jgi:FKBP-type peptidyl-prolyl cis-trans isomerase SlyD
MIKDQTIVKLAYTLTDGEGEVLDQADAKDPFEYLHGGSQIVPGLEKQLSGLTVGAKKKVTVAPVDGYGEIDPSLQMSVKRTQFPGDMQLEVGMQFEASSPDGHDVLFTILEIKGEEVTIDGNHPLAGETLHFDVEVLSVRAATAEEIEHGHAHGPDGHHHH